MTKQEKKQKQEKKKNPVWDKLFEDERLNKEISTLPKHFQMAINHERKCIKFRLKQIERYLERIQLMMAGMDYFDTFKNLSSIHGLGFPKQPYLKLRDKWDKEQEKKSKKSKKD